MNFVVTRSAASLPKTKSVSVSCFNQEMKLTKSHDSLQILRTKFDHDRVSVTIDDFGVVIVSVYDGILSLDLLHATGLGD